MANNGALTPRQRRAIAALLSAKSDREAAKLAGVGYRTLNRWMTQPDFKAALNRASNEQMAAAGRLLLVNAMDTVKKLAELRDQAPPVIQRLAAHDLYDFALRWNEQQNFEARLLALEEFFQHVEK